MSTNQETNPVVSEIKIEQSTTKNKTDNKTETGKKTTVLAKYKKFLYLFFASSAGLLISYFAYKRFQKKH